MVLAIDRKRGNFTRSFILTATCLVLLSLFGLLRHQQRRSLQARDLTALDDDNLLCREVHNAADQCAWVHEYCEDDDVGLLSYLTLYYCKLPQLKAVGFLLIVTWTSLLFSTIGIAASDFFCINLSTMSNFFGMSESMAGVTFLAFGNGSPDVFSTFAAIRTNSGSLAVGELIGAAGFITAVVSGSMALVRPFKVARRSFVRDVGFFIAAIAFSMVFVANGSLELWECAAMVGFYIFYVIAVIIWHWWLGQRRKRREQQAMARGYYVDTAAEGEIDFEAEYHDDDDIGNPPPRPRHPSDADLNNLHHSQDDTDDFDELDEETERDKWMGELSRNMRITRTPISERRNVFNPIRPSLVGALEFQSVLHSLRKSRNIQSHPLHLRRFSDDPTYTLARQHSNAHSAASVPEAAPGTGSDTGAQEPFDAEAQGNVHEAQHGIHGRGRAKSANAADLLGLSPTTWHRRQRSRSNLSSPRPTSRYSDRDSLSVPGQNLNEQPQLPHHVDDPSPVVTVDPPPEDVKRDPSPARRRADTGGLLAPPSPRIHPIVSSEPLDVDPTQDSVPPVRPQLRITPPSPSPNSQYFPTASSPSQSSEHSSPRRHGILQGDIIPSPESMFPVYSQIPDPPRPWRWWPYKIFAPPETIFSALFPTLSSWREKSWFGKITGIVSAPSFLLLTISLPVVEAPADDSEENVSTTSSTADVNKQLRTTPSISSPAPGPDALAHVAVSTEARTRHQYASPQQPQQQNSQPESNENHPHAAVASPREWNRWLVLIQCFTSPYLVVLAVWVNFSEAGPEALMRPTLYSFLGSLVALVFVLVTTRPDRPPRWHFLLCFIGFAVSVTWISTIANEVVGVLKAIGVIFNISDAILGLTIFAVGNSMGDLVADVTVARLGYPVMALSACFGGPMLNILLGIGLSGCYMVIRKADHRHHKHPDENLKFKPYRVEVSTTLMVSAVALLVTLCGLLVVVPLNRWTMDRRIGWGLIGLWVAATAGNLGIELSGVGKAYG